MFSRCNGLSVGIYEHLQKFIFEYRNADPEDVRQYLLGYCEALDRRCNARDIRCILWLLEQFCCVNDSRLETSLWGLKFPNPVGLAAGLDKDGVATNIWPSFGFGYTEIGTVTQFAQEGNLRPRLFRLPQDQAAINCMGFNNQGSAQMKAFLADSRQRQIKHHILGINIGKSKATPLDLAVDDYVASFRLLKTFGSYVVVNVSSPNTPGLRSLQAVEQLEPILKALQAENTESKPLLVKISPDLEWEDIEEIVNLAQQYRLAGIIATNTTTQRPSLRTITVKATGNSPMQEAGGLSGKPLQSRSTDVIRFIWKLTDGKLPIIGVGGVFTAEDAWEKITAGASLLQVYTGWFYEGPSMVPSILKGLLHKLDMVGAKNLSEVVGQNNLNDNKNFGMQLNESLMPSSKVSVNWSD